MKLRNIFSLIFALVMIGAIGNLAAADNEEVNTIQMINEAPGSGYFGVTVADFDADRAEELEYPYGIGCIIESVVPGSPAEEAELQADDIIMGVEDMEVMDKDGFIEIADELQAGQLVYLSIWRDGESLAIPVTLGELNINAYNEETKRSFTFKRGKSVGYGGGTWVPQWFVTDLTDINNLMVGLGFGKLDENGFLMQGGLGRGNVGNGYFLGGQGVSYMTEKKVQNLTDPTYQTWIRYSNSMGGVTFDKRFPLFGKLIGSAGLMLGVGEHLVEITNTNGSYNWNDLSGGENSNLKLSRSYAVVQPRVELLYPLLSWLAIRAEVGYTYGYNGGEGWKLQAGNSELYDVTNSPDTEFQGLNISIGPWFGF